MAAILVAGAAAARAAGPSDGPLRYRLEQGRVAGYAALVEVQKGGQTEYLVAFPLLAVSNVKEGGATVVMALAMAKSKSPDAMPATAAEFHTERIALKGGRYSLNDEPRAFPYLPGSIADQIFTRLPDSRGQRQWGEKEPFVTLGSTDKGYQEERCELLDSSMRFRETFVRHVETREGQPKEEWRGSGEVTFDPQRGLLTRKDFSLTYSPLPAAANSQVNVKLTLRLLDDEAMKRAAQATSVRLPGEAPWQRETDKIKATSASGRWAHVDAPFRDMQRLLVVRDKSAYRAVVVGELSGGQLCYRLEGSRAFWDGYLPPDQFQFIPGEVNPAGANVGMIQSSERDRLLADLTSGEAKRASRAIEQLASLRSQQPDDEIAAGLVQWIGRTDRQLAGPFSEAMQHWATPTVAPALAKALTVPDGVVRRIAEAGLTGAGPRAEGEVGRLLQHSDTEVRTRAMTILGQIGTPASLPSLDALQRDADVRVRQGAELAARQIRERNGIKDPSAHDFDSSRRELEDHRRKMETDFERYRQPVKTGPLNPDAIRRQMEQQRRKMEFDAKARSRAGK